MRGGRGGILASRGRGGRPAPVQRFEKKRPTKIIPNVVKKGLKSQQTKKTAVKVHGDLWTGIFHFSHFCDNKRGHFCQLKLGLCSTGPFLSYSS